MFLQELSAVFYLLVAVAGLVQLIWPRDGGHRLILAGLFIAILAHAIALGGWTVEVGSFPVTGMLDGLSVFAILVAIIAAMIAWKTGVPQAAPMAALLSGVLVGMNALGGGTDKIPEHLRSHWLAAHIALAFLGDAAFAIAGIVAGLYLVQERKLKARTRKQLTKIGTGLHRLPALEVLDHVSVQLIQWGFPLMTLGLITGAFYAKSVRGAYWSWDPLNVVSLLVWVLYALLLHARLTIGWRGRKLAILTVLGVVATLVAFVGLGIAGGGAHGTTPDPVTQDGAGRPRSGAAGEVTSGRRAS